MIAELRYLLATFSGRDRRLLGVLVVAQFVLATTDLVGVAAVLPLMQVLTGTSIHHGVLGGLQSILGGDTAPQFAVRLAALMAVAFILKAALGVAIQWWSTGFIARLQADTSRRLLTTYMGESYLDHRRRGTGEVIRTVGRSVQAAHTNVLGGMLNMASSILSVGLIGVFLVVVTPIPALLAVAYFSIVIFVLQRILAPANLRAGKLAQDSSWVSTHALLDAMQGFREAIMHDAQPYLVDRYDDANRQTVDAARRANFLSQLPKQVLELVTMLGISLLVVFAIVTGNVSSAIPTLGLFAAATVKILPQMVAMTATLGIIRVGREGLSITVHALRQAAAPISEHRTTAVSRQVPDDAPIHISDVSFRYPDGAHDVVHGVNAVIPPGTSMAICGASGSGKTTLIDIILGLIPPTSGTVSYGAAATTEAGSEWHDTVAYVPQDVYITDDTLAGNVAFGLDPRERDDDRVIEALRRAELADLLTELPDGVATRVGERGTRLSGGQRQRVGIARALYRSPRVIILDEATSALDNETEHKITRTLRSLQGDITTVVVAHRLSTVKHVDQLLFLNGGRVEALGSFEEVRRSSPDFARLVKLGDLSGQPPLSEPAEGSRDGDLTAGPKDIQRPLPGKPMRSTISSRSGRDAR